MLLSSDVFTSSSSRGASPALQRAAAGLQVARGAGGVEGQAACGAHALGAARRWSAEGGEALCLGQRRSGRRKREGPAEACRSFTDTRLEGAAGGRWPSMPLNVCNNIYY